MPTKFSLSLTLISALLVGCASLSAPTPSTNPGASDSATAPENKGSEADIESASSELVPRADLVASLPKTIESFEMANAQPFDNDGQGVTISYANARKHRRADVFVYPVDEENKSLEHPELVMGSTQATMRAIAQAVQEGVYHNLNVIDAATKANGMRTIARVQATYLRQNLASYTLVYQTEYDGTLVKIRVTMPDNESNRNSQEWDRFADDVLEAVTKQLEQENSVNQESLSVGLST